MPTPKPVRPSTPPVRTQPCASGGGEAVPVNKQDAPDVESGRPMSAEQKVKSVYPDARAWKHCFDDWQVAHDQKPFVSILTYGHKTEANAWERAASQLPPTEQPQDPLPPLDERLKFERWYAANRMQLYMHLDQQLRCAIEDTCRESWMESSRVSLAESASLRTQLAEMTALEAQRRDELKSAYDSDRAKGEALTVIATEMARLRELLEAGLAEPREGQAK